MLKGNLTCVIVNKLLTYFVEDNLDKKCREMVTLHLRNCPCCMEKYSLVKKLYNEAEKRRKIIRDREKMAEEISEYLDGQMAYEKINDFERKLSTDNEYEKNLIETLKLKRLLNNSFYKVKYNLKTETYKTVMNKVKKDKSSIEKILAFLIGT